MKIIKNKTMAITIAILLAFLMADSLALIPSSVKAQSDNSAISTYAFVSVAPNPAGVNQQVAVTFWLSDPTPNSAGGHGGDRFSGFMMKITAPDGTTQSMGPYTATDEASAFFSFTPTQTGNYTFLFTYPGQTFSDLDVTYAATSATATLTVQQQPALSPTMNPLPNVYWTTPVNGMNYGWSSISGNWLMKDYNQTNLGFDYTFAVDPYASTPGSAHILWTQPLTFGGLAGGQYGSVSYYDGRSYEQIFQPAIIISGRLYFNTAGAEEPYTSGNMGNLGITCIDLFTGQTLFTIPNATLSFGQVYNYVSPNQAGTLAYLWSVAGSTWNLYDAWTGSYILSIDNVPSGVTVSAPDGSILVYSLAYNKTVQTYQLTLWNSTLAIQPNIDQSWEWRVYTNAGQTLNGDQGIEWQVNEPNATGQALAYFLPPQQVGVYDGNAILSFVLGHTLNGDYTSNATTQFYAYDMTNGNFLWNSTIQSPPGLPNDLAGEEGDHGWFESNGVYYQFVKQTEQWIAYNVESGQLLWKSQPYTNDPYGEYDYGMNVANGILYSTGYDGVIRAIDATNGNTLWTFSSGDAGADTPYSTWPFYSGLTVAGGMLIGTTGEHGNGVMPLYQGEAMYVLNATTGKLLWNMPGWFEQPAIGDSIMVSHNCYDNQIYAFGKGPSATTVTAPDVGVTTATPVTIRGTVIDKSAGTQQVEQAADFPNGVPCVSDASMTQFMDAVYEQQPMPTNVTGVPVTISVTDSNGNCYDVGTATTNANGFYSLTWTPTIPGNFTITATFAGTQSYYGSTANTAFYASAASSSSTTAPATVTGNYATTTEFMIGIVALAVMIALIGAVLALLMLRKRP